MVDPTQSEQWRVVKIPPINPHQIESAEQLHEQLVALFHQGNWSQHRLADAAGLSKATVNAILTRTTHLPRKGTLVAFVTACGQESGPWLAARGRIQASTSAIPSGAASRSRRARANGGGDSEYLAGLAISAVQSLRGDLPRTLDLLADQAHIRSITSLMVDADADEAAAILPTLNPRIAAHLLGSVEMHTAAVWVGGIPAPEAILILSLMDGNKLAPLLVYLGRRKAQELKEAAQALPAMFSPFVMVPENGREDGGLNSRRIGGPPDIEWTFPLGSGGGYASFLAVAEGTIYVSDATCLWAVDAASGERRWNRALSYASAPAANDGLLFVGDGRHLYAFDAADGGEVWRLATENSDCSPPTVAEGVVYIGGDASLWAVHARTGQLHWPEPYRALDTVRAAPAAAFGRVYFGSYDHRFRALDAATGRQVWSFEADGAWLHSPLVTEGAIYAPNNRRLYAINPESGATRWTYEGWWWTPAFAEKFVYVGGTDRIVALDASSGRECWRREGVGGAPIISDGTLYAAQGGVLRAMDPATGRDYWVSHLSGHTWWKPVITLGRVYVGVSYSPRNESVLLAMQS
ncbi:PQQ-binding-like beta-propeller repeat protein [Streptomyces sviceus]|uniref:outer membrane protein assembly factor BamB family protein n=1 Tax=Streptomyces sviceus TaxID=285530 RepID=UPI00332C8224